MGDDKVLKAHFNAQWQSNFDKLSPGYEIFYWLPSEITVNSSWPTLEKYNSLISPNFALQTNQGLPIQFVQEKSEESYEATIYLSGKVHTREQNWHDFFNMLIWYAFPLIKSDLNAKHFQHNNKIRTPFENFLTLFDENGVIVLSSDNELLDLIRHMSWKELFWYRRAELISKCKFFIFGHSLHEKLLAPYIGLTGHSLLFYVEQNFFETTIENQLTKTNLLAQNWLRNIQPSNVTPRTLLPLPILGIPGWHAESANEHFYSNSTYFRASRS